MSYVVQKKSGVELNRFYEEDQSIHDWYRFILSYPPHLVRDYITKFGLTLRDCILDPFAGTGTTLVESKKMGIASIGIEANPVAHMAASTKIDWDVDTKQLLELAHIIADRASRVLLRNGGSLRGLPPESERLLIANSISPVPLHKCLVLIDEIYKCSNPKYLNIFKTAIAKQAVFNFSNLKFGPEVGVSRKKRADAAVISLWLEQIEKIAKDVDLHKDLKKVKSTMCLADARSIGDIIPDKSISAIICSPPYPNEKDYTRTTRLESVLLGFMNDKYDLRRFKQSLLRSNTKNVYKGDEDFKWVDKSARIQKLSKKIENRRIELEKDSGFERLYHKVVKLYFGGMVRHLEEIKPKLKNGAQLAYVVGDQASYFRIKIETGEILAELAEQAGYKVTGIDLFRTRLSTVTKEQLREEVVLLKWKK